MRSDAKLGLALGMLVIGFAIAFCFPREGRKASVIRALVESTPADAAEIEFVPIHSLRDKGSHSHNTLPVVPAEIPEKLTDIEQSEVVPTLATRTKTDLTQSKDRQYSSETGLADLLRTPAAVESAIPDQAATPSEVGEVLPSSITQQRQHVEEKNDFSTYRVQPGDTLSAISMKTLGSYHRYLDIYEANRDKLSSPDDLRLGMDLRIPTSINGNQLVPQPDPAIVRNEEPTNNKPEHSRKSDSEPQTREADGASVITDRRVDLPVNQIHPQGLLTHTVVAGDTLERIAVQYFGTVRAVDQLRRANPKLAARGNRLLPGMSIQLIP